jgi:hypothetical protein
MIPSASFLKTATPTTVNSTTQSQSHHQEQQTMTSFTLENFLYKVVELSQLAFIVKGKGMREMRLKLNMLDMPIIMDMKYQFNYEDV